MFTATSAPETGAPVNPRGCPFASLAGAAGSFSEAGGASAPDEGGAASSVTTDELYAAPPPFARVLPCGVDVNQVAGIAMCLPAAKAS